MIRLTVEETNLLSIYNEGGKHCPILKGIIEKWYLRICFYQV